MNADQQKENKLTLDLLDAIEQQDDVSQRHLAQHMGIALGLANTYLKRCVKKGWVKITTAPANRYLYYLTPTGFSEKARLTSEFLTTSLTLVRQSGDAYLSVYQQCLEEGCSQVIFVGLSDLTEMAYLRVLDKPLEILGVYQREIDKHETHDTGLTEKGLSSVNLYSVNEWFGVPVVQTIPESWSQAAFVVTALNDGAELIALIQSEMNDAKIYVPEFLAMQAATSPRSPVKQIAAEKITTEPIEDAANKSVVDTISQNKTSQKVQEA